MTDRERLIARLEERIAIHSTAAEALRPTEPVKADVAQAWADSAAACLYDVRTILDDVTTTVEEYVEAAVGAYVP